MKMKKKSLLFISQFTKKIKHLFQNVDFLINSIVFYCDHFVFGIESDKITMELILKIIIEFIQKRHAKKGITQREYLLMGADPVKTDSYVQKGNPFVLSFFCTKKVIKKLFQNKHHRHPPTLQEGNDFAERNRQ